MEYVPFEVGRTESADTYDIGVIIALTEEGDLFLESVKASKGWKKSPEPKMFWKSEQAWWEFELLPNEGGVAIRVVVSIIGDMGTEQAVIATERMTTLWSTPLWSILGSQVLCMTTFKLVQCWCLRR